MIKQALRTTMLAFVAILVVAMSAHFAIGEAIAQAVGSVPDRLNAIQNTVTSIETKTDNLQNTANSIQNATTSIQNTVNDIQNTVNSLESETDAIEIKLDHSARLAIVKMKFTTQPSSTTGVNIDLAGSLPLDKIKRYTLTIHPALLVTVPSGTDSIEVISGVLDGTTSFDVKVVSQDTSAMSGFPSPGTTVSPYTGTNSYIRVVRGADGLGPVDVRVNAYVEMEP